MNAIEIIVLPPSTRGLCLTKHECYRNNTATFHQRSLPNFQRPLVEGGYIYVCTHMCTYVSQGEIFSVRANWRYGGKSSKHKIKRVGDPSIL